MSVLRRQREIIDCLLEKGLVTNELIEDAREETRRSGLCMTKALQKLNYIDENSILSVKSEIFDIPYIDLLDFNLDTKMIEKSDEKLIKKHFFIPLFQIKDILTIGIVDPFDLDALDSIKKAFRVEMLELILVSEESLQTIIDQCYGDKSSINDIIEDVEDTSIKEIEEKEQLNTAEGAPIIKLVNIVINQAIKDRASDIHIEPSEDMIRVRNRIDGVLHEYHSLPKKIQSAFISRIKILSQLDISEKRKPQDGIIRLIVEGKDFDLRVSTFPTIHGENIVMRILDKSKVVLTLQDIGFLPEELESFEKCIQRPNGIIFVTGPTGSGKTSTLYTALNAVSTIEKNIITIEDPVEYELPLIRQTQINVKAGMTFSAGLRSILRQDPDIIMVGEIRDKETADIAIQAALTGHLVFSTLHTNDAPSALTRLADMGIEPFLVSSSTIAIVAQRLVRLICQHCKTSYTPSETILKSLNLDSQTKFHKGCGCQRCKNTGYGGRLAISELLVINEEIRQLILQNKSSDEIKSVAVKNGMKTMKDNGILQVINGLTTYDEVLRVTELER